MAGFGAGVVNAVAGGGTFLTFAALVATGMPTIEANATSAVALNPANIATAYAYRREIIARARHMMSYAIISIIGGLVGALLLIGIGDEGFRPTVPWLLLMATLLFAGSDKIREAAAPWAETQAKGASLIAGFIMFLVAIYGGFFAAGMGIMMLAALIITEKGDYHQANAIKVLASALIQIMASIALIAGGLVNWPATVAITLSSIAGGYYGVSLARKVPSKMVRFAVVGIGAILTVVFFIRT